MKTLTRKISGWGRYPIQSCELIRPEKYADLHAYTDSCIARGQGRSYGDASLNENHTVILTEKLNRFVQFDRDAGILTAEAGVTLKDILNVIVPHHWFLPVTPGTQFVSLGGCVASDVHGKNHHKVGSFGEYVLSLVLILADGSRLHCSPSKHPEIFWATIGGMGLTGIIGEVTLKLISLKNNAMNIAHYAQNSLEEICHAFHQSQYDDDYSVTWLDIQREQGIMMSAHHDQSTSLINIKPKLSRFSPPGILLNRYSINLFNKLYFGKHSRKTKFNSHYENYFYPLDGISHWNTMYGKNGFVQYQCVFPMEASVKGLKDIFKIMRKHNTVSFLSVLKKMGSSSAGLLSFPLEGLTLAMDIPFHSKKTPALLKECDAVVAAHHGRVYLAKDACLSAKHFRAMYPNYEKFMEIKDKVDPQHVFSSSLSRRLRIGK